MIQSNLTPSLLICISGGHYAERESRVATHLNTLPESETSAVILEGLPVGQSMVAPELTQDLLRIAPGCFCCIGNLVLRTSLNRILRKSPKRIYLAMAQSEHLDNLLIFLQQSPYDQLLKLDQTIRI